MRVYKQHGIFVRYRVSNRDGRYVGEPNSHQRVLRSCPVSALSRIIHSGGLLHVSSTDYSRRSGAYMSPGSVTERLHFFVAEYEDRDRVSTGGGDANEGEEIETLEMTLDEAMRMIDSGAIQDGKTSMLLQYAHRIGLRNP